MGPIIRCYEPSRKPGFSHNFLKMLLFKLKIQDNDKVVLQHIQHMRQFAAEELNHVEYTRSVSLKLALQAGSFYGREALYLSCLHSARRLTE